MNNQNNKSSNGFLFGMLVGGALVFLLGTKKGRKILKNLSGSGLDTLEDLLEVDEIKSLYEDDETDDIKDEEIEVHKNGQSLKKRFFKGAKKK